jgi:ATP-binding cassette, subfamily B, bacterial
VPPPIPLPAPRTTRERVDALRNLPPFLRLVWETSASLTIGSLLLRAIRALLPVATLFVGKLIIDEVVGHAQAASSAVRPGTLGDWYASGLLDRLLWLLAAEFALAVLADVLGRLVALLDTLLSEQFANTTSVRLMEHAATLDLEDFEDSELQDRLDRARRQASGRMTLITQLFGQAQDIVTIVAFAAGLVVYAPWLIALLVIALVPAFLGEAHFNAQSYALAYARTPEQRELDYVRQTGASVESAKEVKIFGLNAFLIERYRQLATGFYEANRRLAIRRAGWGGALTALGTIGYYVAYGYLAWRTLAGQFTVGDLTFLAGSFRRLRTLLEELLVGFSQTAGQALYLDDLSGGEWQKVAIARAYMRDAQLLILDEPTAALDARSEFEVFQRFKELSAGKSAVLISHRFSSVRMADRILVLADGTVEAAGTHEELMAQRGRYAELFELQAAGYR